MLERIDPFSKENVAKLCQLSHIKRYAMAAQLVKPNSVVLDAGCGSGYGSAMLAANSRWVFGVDSDLEAVLYASQNYDRKNITYVLQDFDFLNIQMPKRPDLITFFEVIEHLEKPQKALLNFRDVISASGTLLLSTPNGANPYVQNEHHLKEYSEVEMVKMLEQCGFKTTSVLCQYPLLGALLPLFRKGNKSEQSSDQRMLKGKDVFSSIPFLPEIFSEFYSVKVLRNTSRQLLYVAEPA